MSDPMVGGSEVASGGFSIVSGVWEYLKGGDIRFKTGRIRSTSHPECDKACPPQETTEAVIDVAVSFFGLKRARCVVFLAFEWNGCDIRNARALIGNDSFIGTLSGASFEVEAEASDSFFTAGSKCECCRESACVTFDIVVTNSAALTIGTGRLTRRFRLCGDGSVTPLPTP